MFRVSAGKTWTVGVWNHQGASSLKMSDTSAAMPLRQGSAWTVEWSSYMWPPCAAWASHSVERETAKGTSQDQAFEKRKKAHDLFRPTCGSQVASSPPQSAVYKWVPTPPQIQGEGNSISSLGGREATWQKSIWRRGHDTIAVVFVKIQSFEVWNFFNVFCLRCIVLPK